MASGGLLPKSEASELIVQLDNGYVIPKSVVEKCGRPGVFEDANRRLLGYETHTRAAEADE